MGNSVSSSLPVPKGFKFQGHLAEGKFGTVYQCVQQGTEHTIVVKTIKEPNRNLEASMLRELMAHNLDKFNIVTFYGSFISQNTVSLMFETLDISLREYLKIVRVMPLEDVRIVIQQMATALDALKRTGVIHTDLKPDNIMMVDRVRQPMKVKLIDFGSAIYKFQATPGMTLQPFSHRAPEITSGLPFSESVDIWSLGCVMINMVFGFSVFPGIIEFDTKNLEKYSPMWQCIDLLEAIFKENESDRITPSGILNHPFITKGYLNSSSRNAPLESAAAEPGISQVRVVDSRIETLAPDIIMVPPEDPMNRIHLEETSALDSEMSPHPAAAAATDVDTTRIQDNTEPPPTTADNKKIMKNSS